MLGWLRGGHKSHEAASAALGYVRGKLTGGVIRGLHGEQIVYPRAAVRLLSPLPRPNSFRDFSIYEEHGSRRDGDDPALRRRKPPNWYRWPPYYKGSVESFFGPEDPIPYVYYTKRLDLEPEIGIVIGREGRNLSFEEARGVIAGYTIVIDCSDRGAGQRDTLGPAKSKDWATMMGPCLVTADELDAENLRLRVVVDGETWFDGNTGAPHAFAYHEVVAYASDNETLKPGDVLGTGTIGTGASMDLHRWPQIGQRFAVEVEGIGRLEHPIVAGERVVDYVGSGLPGRLAPAPTETVVAGRAE